MRRRLLSKQKLHGISCLMAAGVFISSLIRLKSRKIWSSRKIVFTTRSPWPLLRRTELIASLAIPFIRHSWTRKWPPGVCCSGDIGVNPLAPSQLKSRELIPRESVGRTTMLIWNSLLIIWISISSLWAFLLISLPLIRCLASIRLLKLKRHPAKKTRKILMSTMSETPLA